jgi:cytochrome c biogenesis protein CcdA/thiol-disulfide isomerase/thioredoxin
MAPLALFAFVSGIVTILSPCILPILPLLLSGTIGGSNTKTKPLGIISGFVASFTIFTLLLTSLVQLLHIDPDLIRYLAVATIFFFGLSLVVPALQKRTEEWFSLLSNKLSTKKSGKNQSAYLEGFLIGISLGILWSPCVGPILASVIALALTGAVSFDAFLIVLAYAAGTAIPMFMIMTGGKKILAQYSFITNNTQAIQRFFGVLMIITAIAIATGFDRKFQTYFLTAFPNYGTGLTKFESNPYVTNLLNLLNKNKNVGALDLSDQDQTVESNFDNDLPKYALAPELIPSGKWFNSEPLTLASLRGKVVLLDFWTYSCINCQRTLPYLRNWWEKYKDKGLVIIGIHSPEFEFEKDPTNVQSAIDDFTLHYPIFQDNNFSTWRAYSNQYWPAKYLVDKDGYIRYYHFGEGSYAETEKIIQTLLEQATNTDIAMPLNTETYTVNTKTPETYLGFYRSSNMASPENVVKDKVNRYSVPKNLNPNKYALAGDWLISGEYAEASPNSELILNFDAERVFLVMRTTDGQSARVKVYVDDKLQFFGSDNKDGIVTITKDTLYDLVKIPGGGRHILKLQFIDGKVQAFAFTFG